MLGILIHLYKEADVFLVCNSNQTFDSEMLIIQLSLTCHDCRLSALKLF